MNQINTVKISITGDLGSGKSSVCEILQQKYNLFRYSTGVIQREIAAKRSMTTYELNKYMETHPEIDTEIDDGLKALAKSEKSLVIDSRMAWHFVPNTFKVFLTVDVREAARRIMIADRGNIEQYSSTEEAVQMLYARKESENNRYKKQYNVDCSDLSNYDAVIDTTISEPEEIADLIMNLYEKYAQGLFVSKYWSSYKKMYPTQTVRNTNMDRVHEYENLLNEGNDIPVVMVLEDANRIYVFDGHHRVYACANLGKNMIPYAIVGKTGDILPNGIAVTCYVRNECNLTNIYDWEDMLGFRYLEYPEQARLK